MRQYFSKSYKKQHYNLDPNALFAAGWRARDAAIIMRDADITPHMARVLAFQLAMIGRKERNKKL